MGVIIPSRLQHRIQMMLYVLRDVCEAARSKQQATLTKDTCPAKILFTELAPPHGGAFYAARFLTWTDMTDPVSTFDTDPDLPQATNLAQSSADLVQAELVRMHQSAAQEIDADEVEFHLSAALNVKAETVSAHETAIGLVNAKEVSLTNSSAAAVRAETVNINGMAGIVAAGTANLGNTYAGAVAAREVRAERIETFMLLSNHVEGEIHTVMGSRQALLAGLTGGLFAGLVLLLGRALFRRD